MRLQRVDEVTGAPSAPHSAEPSALHSEECGCAPTPAERRALWPAVVNRRTAIGLGALGVAGALLFTAPRLPAAYAAGYPSWDDVQRAKQNEATKASEVTNIQNLINTLTQNVETTRAIAEQRANEYYEAEHAFFEAADRADELQKQADEQAAVAKESADKAARLAVKLYRTGGDDAALQLLLAGSAAGADDLLARLGKMDKLLERNRDVYAAAVTARNSAQSLSDQAVVARNKRDELKQIAEQKLAEAQAAADAAQAALDAQTQHLAELQAQLAALKDTTAQTVAGYQAGVEAERKAKEERERKEREAAAAAGRASGGGSVGGSGWCRPAGGSLLWGFGPRPRMCGANFCGSTNHRGIDLGASCGMPIYAAASGVVTAALPNYSGYGNYIRIDHGGVATGYAHIRDGGFAVSRGQHVSAGQVIAYVGQTGNAFGCHLHFEVYNPGTIDPAAFLRARGVSV